MIKVENLRFTYAQGGFELSVPEFHVDPGERIAIVGPSGSGKTTLLRLLAGIVVPETGRIRIDEVEMSDLAREDRQDYRALTMGLIFQDFALLDYLDVIDNILLPYRINTLLTLDGEARERARALTDLVGLGGKSRMVVSRLSQGERQRTSVCRSLVTCPKIVIADEPTANLDEDNRDRIISALFDYSDQHRIPLIVVTHDSGLHGRFDRIVDIRSFA